MELFGEMVVAEFAKRHANSRGPLARFLDVAKAADWQNLMDVRSSFAATDYVNETYVFNVGGNKYRVLAAIDFEARYLSITEVLTHEEYNRKKL